MKSGCFSLLVSLMALLAAVSCVNSDTIDGEVSVTTWDIATFHGNIDGLSTFAVSPGGDSPEATLTSVTHVDEEKISAGSRVYIAYIPQARDPYVSCDINLLSISSITDSEVKSETFDPAGGWDADPVYIITLWRTGRYINVYCRLPYYKEPRRFSLIADASTVKSARPQLYLEHALPEEVNSFSRAYYASFDISDVWDLPSTEAVDIHVNNSNLPVTLYTFSK